MTSAQSARLLEEKLKRAIEGDVRFDAGALTVYSTDASNYRQVPLGVVAPRHEGDVAAALAIARDAEIPVLSRGAGTSLAGQATNAAVVLDFSRYMNRIVAIDPGRRIADVEPGVVQAQLNSALAPHGLFFAPDPSTKDRCTIGGMIGNNSCGAHSAAYGKTVDNLAALDALLYDGTRLRLGAAMSDGDLDGAIARGGREGALLRALRSLRDRTADSIRAHYPKIPRRVSGYNLDELLPERGFNLARALVGSEGTLAVTLRATLLLAARPKHLAMVVLGFDDIFLAGDQMPWLLEHRPEALEGFDHHLPDLARVKGLAGVRLLPAGSAFLVIEVGADSAADARERAERVLADARGVRECGGVALISDAREQTAVWSIRESGLGAGAFVAGRPRTWPGAEDAAVPPARLGEYLRRFHALLARRRLEAATYYGHFGEGCVHARINFDLANAGGVAELRAAMTEIAALVVEMGGSLSGEHGDGIARSELLPMMYPSDVIAAFADFKRAFDPDSRMNPGVIVAPHPLDSHLRLGPHFRPRAIETHFDFSAEGGLAGAAMKCVGIGKCRKTDAGTMCPSYMATRDEIHSTRGRARLLFEALGGDLLAGGLTDSALKEALDWCLACKGCKTECPSSVDMAAYRAEFFAHYYREHRRPLNGELFGRMHEIARLASWAPQLANLLAHAPALESFGKRMLAIHRARTLPRFARRTFRDWFARRAPAPAATAREVVLFPDTFSNFFEPQVAIAATEVLEHAGFRVTIPPRDLCCGRPLYDQGMLDRARRRLADAMEALAPMAERSAAIVGLEPSCILTFRDELPALFPRDPRTHTFASSALLLDEFLAREAAGFAPAPLHAPALLHGHCHQKALAGIGGETAILRRIEGLALGVLDAGCCGMAGAFGYHNANFDLSRAIGARALFPAIERAAPETIVIADGFSCRTQIRQFCPARHPLHFAEVLRMTLSPEGAAQR